MKWIDSYHLFLFDFDGLLVNTEEVHFRAYQRMCANRGLPLDWSFEKYCQFAHYSASALKEYLYQEYPQLYKMEPDWAVLYAEKKEIVLKLIAEGAIQLMPGAKRLLEELAKRNVKRCVVTNSPKELVELLKQQHPILKTIPHWFTREHYTHPKPHSECYLHAIDQLGSSKDEIIGFEDSPRGVTALLGTPARPVLICETAYPEISDFQKKGVIHYRSFEAIPENSIG